MKRAAIFIMLAAIALAGCKSETSTSAPGATATQVTTDLDPNTGKPVRVTQKTATATGTGANAAGDKVEQNMKSEPASVSIDGIMATGGGGDSQSKAKTDSGTFWLRLICGLFGLVAFAVGVYLLAQAVVRPGMTFCITGGVLIACAIWPWLMLFGLAGVALFLIWPYVKAEIVAAKQRAQAQSNESALRAVVTGIESIPEDAQEIVKSEIAKQATNADRDAITAAKRKEATA